MHSIWQGDLHSINVLSPEGIVVRPVRPLNIIRFGLFFGVLEIPGRDGLHHNSSVGLGGVDETGRVDHCSGEYPKADKLVLFLDRLWPGLHPLLEEGRELGRRNIEVSPRLRLEG